MEFKASAVAQAEGGILAHSVRANGLNLRKGRVLSRADLEALGRAGVESVVIARLNNEDLGENEAAARIAAAAAGDHVRVGAAFTGRANLYAREHGLALVDAALVDRINLIHESITLATVAPYGRVSPRQMLATVKIIPFAAPASAVAEATGILSAGSHVLRVVPFVPRRAALISTTLPGMKASIPDMNRSALDKRLHAIGSEIVFERRTPHETALLASAIREAVAAKADPILVFGASAITDRRDTIPSAIVEAGGQIDHLGMPVDPGNLLLVGRVGGSVAIGLPGCARSPKLNGIDFVLWRVAAGLPVGRDQISRMGVGGLLTEIPTRPQPRDEAPAAVPSLPNVAAIVLAAGRSSRMGSNKLLAPAGGKPLVRHSVEAAVKSAASATYVITGNEAKEVAATLADLPVTLVNNPDYTKGLSSSLKRAVKALPASFDAAVVVLGDMPGVTTQLIDRLIAAFDPAEGRGICVATRHGKRGNPVLWAKRFFPEMDALEGDVGAKYLMTQHSESVCEVEADDDGPLIDIDTPEALAAYRGL
jgi:molybdenum cofactor cytidylyltransferase